MDDTLHIKFEQDRVAWRTLNAAQLEWVEDCFQHLKALLRADCWVPDGQEMFCCVYCDWRLTAKKRDSASANKCHAPDCPYIPAAVFMTAEVVRRSMPAVPFCES